MDGFSRLLSLGRQRLRIFECLGTSRFSPAYFEPDADADIFEAFHAFVARTSQLLAGDTCPISVSLLAAGRVLTGDLAAADVVLDHLPPDDFKLDHGAGVCSLAPLYALCAALPLPTDMKRTDRWRADAHEPTALRAWLASHRDKLRWVEAPGVYLPRPSERQAKIAQPEPGTRSRVRHIMTSGRELWHSISDLTVADGLPAVMIPQPWNRDRPAVSIPLDVGSLHHIDWEDAEYVYEVPIEGSRPIGTGGR